MIARSLLFAALLLAAQPGRADDSICTDRPSKADAPCTVPAGHFKFEADALDWQTSRDGATRSDRLSTNPVLKYGLGSATDIEIGWSPFIHERLRDPAGTSVATGVGDVTARLKHRLTAPDAGFQLALLPFLAAPTASHGLGAGGWETGIILPASLAIPGGWTLAAAPQLASRVNSSGDGHHAQASGALNLAKAIGAVALGAEIWTAQDYEPAGTVRQASVDVGLAWLARPALQFDIGANFGLNAATPDADIYIGIASRF